MAVDERDLLRAALSARDAVEAAVVENIRHIVYLKGETKTLQEGANPDVTVVAALHVDLLKEVVVTAVADWLRASAALLGGTGVSDDYTESLRRAADFMDSRFGDSDSDE